MAQLTRLVAPLLALLLAGSAGLAADTPKALVGRVVGIVDGDTIKVRIGDRTETVRYKRCAWSWTCRNVTATGGCWPTCTSAA